MDCPNCGKKNVSGDECPYCGVVFSKLAALKAKKTAKFDSFVKESKNAPDNGGRYVVREGFDFLGLFDFTFTKFYMPTLITALYILGMLFLLCVSIFVIVFYIKNDKSIEGAITVLWGLPIAWIMFRVWLEKQIVFFRIEKHLNDLSYSNLENMDE